MYNDIARKHGNAAAQGFCKYGKFCKLKKSASKIKSNYTSIFFTHNLPLLDSLLKFTYLNGFRA